jgi:hypothetical protein
MTMTSAELLGVSTATVSSPVGLLVEDLIALALRRNRRRAHLLVSTVLGKHIGVDPRVVHGCGLLLGGLVHARLSGTPVPASWTDAAQAAVRGRDPDALLRAVQQPAVPVAAPTVTSWRGAGGPVVLGFAETATALGHSVADALGARTYLHSTRRPSPEVTAVGSFEEGHSHATTHLLLPSPPSLLAGSDPLVLVDDELSTGRTAMGAIGVLHALFPGRTRYLVATLVDLRSTADEAAMSRRATDLGLRVDVVSLVRGRVMLPPEILELAAAHIAASTGQPQIAGNTGEPGNSGERGYGGERSGPAEHRSRVAVRTGRPAARSTVQASWPIGLRQGGRFGFTHGAQPAFRHAASRIAVQLRAALPPGVRRVLVIGTEELMYLPLRLALDLAVDHDVWFQSTTRSPVHPETTPGSLVRSRTTFAADDGTERYLYNATVGFPREPADPEVIVLVTDDLPGAAVEALAALSVPLVTVRLPAERLRQQPLRGPTFGSYPADEVGWLLTDLSDADLEGAVGDREERIQAGAEHYAESLPVEYQPGAEYTALFADVLAGSARRLAIATGLLTELVLAERGRHLVLASLARAGTPVGILMRRWALRRHGLDLPHYAVSIVRDRGIDPVALEHLAAQHDPSSVLFVDGWTGKGAITVELAEALALLRATGGPAFDPTIAVLADPGSCTPLFGTRDDFLIASACLNSTVSGLVSRTVLNPELTSPQQFHGAKFYPDLASADVSNIFVDTVSPFFDAVAADVAAHLPAFQSADRTPTFAGWRSVESIQRLYGLPSINLVKPGVGETTRVLLRRIPWKVLVRQADSPDHAHIRMLAADRGVPVEVVPELPYACMGLVQPMGARR